MSRRISSSDSELDISFDELDWTGYEKDESDTEIDPEGDIEQEIFNLNIMPNSAERPLETRSNKRGTTRGRAKTRNIVTSMREEMLGREEI